MVHESRSSPDLSKAGWAVTEHAVHQFVVHRGPVSSEQLFALAMKECPEARIQSEQELRNAIGRHIGALCNSGRIVLNMDETGFVATTNGAAERTRLFMQQAGRKTQRAAFSGLKS